MTHIDPDEPFCDGVAFNDLQGLPEAAARMLIARGLVYATDFEAKGKTYCGMIVAGSHAQAVSIAFGRGLDEIVTGLVVKIVPED